VGEGAQQGKRSERGDAEGRAQCGQEPLDAVDAQHAVANQQGQGQQAGLQQLEGVVPAKLLRCDGDLAMEDDDALQPGEQAHGQPLVSRNEVQRHFGGDGGEGGGHEPEMPRCKQGPQGVGSLQVHDGSSCHDAVDGPGDEHAELQEGDGALAAGTEVLGGQQNAGSGEGEDAQSGGHSA
jgi:hypothetical protein